MLYKMLTPSKGHYSLIQTFVGQCLGLDWDGSYWSYQNTDWETLDSNEVAYYMYLGDIPMPENW